MAQGMATPLAPEPAASASDAIAVAPAPTSGPSSPTWRDLSVKEKVRYDAKHLFEPSNLVYAAIGAAVDQARDRPSQWGQGWGIYGGRYASHIGQFVIQRSIMGPVQAIDGEDTRYHHSKRTSYGGRLGDAFLHTVWRPDHYGGYMPAYSEFFGDYGAAAVSRMWWPANYHKGASIFAAGSDTILIDAGINVFREFSPDMKRWLHFTR